MKIRELLQEWEQSAGARMSARSYRVALPLHDAARIKALATLYPGRSEEQLIAELLSAALDELEAAFPYVQGERVVAEDEQGDPIYEDAGLTPRFYRLTQRYVKELEEELRRRAEGSG